MKTFGKILKIAGIVLGILIILVVILGLVAFFIINSKFSKINRTEITGNMDLSLEEIYEEDPTVDEPDSVEEINEVQREFLEAQKIEITKKSGVENILLIGADRHGINENGRSDSMIMITLNYNTKKIHMTSFMRAMYVCIPRSDGHVWGMLNAAYSWGGPNLLIDTIELNFRVSIDHYIVVDYAAFETAIDLLGGLEVTVTEQEGRLVRTVDNKRLPAGTHVLNGLQTRRYCQIRAIDNDFKRTARQRKVIDLLVKKAASSDINTLMNLADEIFPLVSTDIQDNSVLWNYIFKTFPMLGNLTGGRMLPIENEAGESYTGIIFVGGREMYRVNFAKNIAALHEYINS